MSIVDDSFYRRPEGVRDRTSAGGIVVRRAPDGTVLLALVRGEATDDSIATAYILPKGGVDPGESIEDAARREIEEEAGFTAGSLRLLTALGTRERLNYARRYWITTHYFAFATDETDPRPTDPNYDYVTDWFPLDGPLPTLFWPEQRALIEGERDRIRGLLLDG
jgi:8-oxo-dGTP pyrophosphatase MutT (NUDIX family)